MSATTRRKRSGWLIGMAAALLCTAAFAQPAGPTGQSPDPQRIEFFEKKIRPLFVEKCYECHSAAKVPPEGGLRLDRPELVLQGGNRGPAIVPGYPDLSLLIEAVSYEDVDLRMPPKGKLSDGQIADLVRWIEMDAALPSEAASAEGAGSEKEPAMDLEAGRRFWVFQPVTDPLPPRIKDSEWPRNEVDRFILAELEKSGLSPAAPADRATLLRRVTFDLTGLPPSPEEVRTFLSDPSEDAYAPLVERLLASSHYGERWARHWLDLMRFAETNGHEYDNDKADAWRYRDYLIRAFNEDVAYDQLIREHIAGDLLDGQRLSADGSHWESPIGTAFLWFGEVLNSPVDSVQSRADEVDNQIDVLSKAFQGLTVACARCHDHKFDPIPTADYYSLAGILHSTDYAESVIDSPRRVAEIRSARQGIWEVNKAIRELLSPVRRTLADRLAADLAAAGAAHPQSAPGPETTDPVGEAWRETLNAACHEGDHLFHPLAALVDEGAGNWASFEKRLEAMRERLETIQGSSLQAAARERGDEIFDDFSRSDFSGWTVAGQAFASGPQLQPPPNQPLRNHQGGGLANSFGEGAEQLVGSLTSSKFVVRRPWIHVRLAGSEETGKGEKAELRVTVVAAGHKATHFIPKGGDVLEWQSQKVAELVANRICYIEIVDRSRTGHIAVERIVFSDSPEPPAAISGVHRGLRQMLAQPGLRNLEDLARGYQHLLAGSLADPARDRDSRWLQSAVVPFAREEDAAILLGRRERRSLYKLVEEREKLAGAIPSSAFSLVARDGPGADVRVHQRGSHKNLGELTPRGYLQVLRRNRSDSILHGSGRRQLAERLSSPDNPLTARVMVNRVWKHLFGTGLVATPDNFGMMGRKPSHPLLLDYLAGRFMESGWSIKSLIRLLVTSNAYRMSSRADPAAVGLDPDNRLLHHMPVRRLEAEAIRDAILSVSGSLQPTLFGPSLVPFISDYQDGRGKPESGPLDGEGRRSLYIQIRRNFLPPLFLAFDYPLPISTIGRRGISTVPSQALMLLNNEFVAQQAQLWGQRIVQALPDESERIEAMFVRAFARMPEKGEIEEAFDFLATQRVDYGIDPGKDDPRIWGDLGHVLMNSTEFIFVR